MMMKGKYNIDNIQHYLFTFIGIRNMDCKTTFFYNSIECRKFFVHIIPICVSKKKSHVRIIKNGVDT